MKYLFLLMMLFAAHVMAEESKQKVTIGAGPYIQTQPYKGVDDILLPSPVIFFDNGLFYVRWSRAGVYFLGEKKRIMLGDFLSLSSQEPMVMMLLK
jgi:outer membrane protein